MSFLVANAPKRGTESVDVRFAELVEPLLYKDNVFQPEITYTGRYETDAAGQIVVRKLSKGTVDKTTGLTFTHEQTADTLIPLLFDEQYKKSEQIFEAVEIARASGTGAQKFEVVMNAVQEEWQADAHAALIAGASTAANTAVTTDAKAEIVALRKQLRDNGAKPTVLIASTKFYAGILNFSGKEYQPNTNDEILRTGVVGRFYDINVVESNHFEDEGENGDVECIMYDHNAFSILNQLIAARVVDAGIDWVGSAAQCHIIASMTVTNIERVLKKIVGIGG